MLLPLGGVSLTVPLDRLDVVLPRVGAAVGETLEAGPAFRDEVLMVRVRGVPKDEILRRIADGVDGRWERKDARLLLVPDAVKAARRKAAERETNRLGIRRARAEIAEAIAEKPTVFGPAEAKALKLAREATKRRRAAMDAAQNYGEAMTSVASDEGDPGWRLAAGLALLVPESAYVDQPLNTNVVYAERPWPIQRKMPPGADDLLARYRREIAHWKPEVQPSRILLRTTRWEQGSAFTVGIRVLDPTGKLVDQGGVRMASDRKILMRPGGHGAIPPGLPVEKPLARSPEEESLLSAIAPSLILDSDRQGSRKDLERWRDELLHPDRVETMRVLPGLRLMRVVEAKGLNVVGAPMDQWQDDDRKDVTPSLFLAHRAWGMTVKDGWLEFDRESRYDRRLAGELLRNAVARGGFSVDEAARWVAKRDKYGTFYGPFGYAMRTLVPQWDLFDSPEDSLRIWNAIPLAARNTLLAGKPMDLAALPLPVRVEIARQAIAMDRAETDAADVTEALPNGVVGGTLTLKITETPVFFAWKGPEEPPHRRVMTAKEFGRFSTFRNTWMDVQEGPLDRYDRFRMGTDRTYLGTVDFGRATFAFGMTEVFLPPGAAPVDRLPSALLAEAEEARQKALVRRPRSPGEAPPPR